MTDGLDAYYDISLNDKEVSELSESQMKHSKKIVSKYELDAIEKTICWISGLTAGVMDAVLLKAPKAGGFLNEKSNNFINNIFTKEQISRLEKQNWVSYDAANSANLTTEISGLSSRSHRFQSLGHDPILGFFFGVKDILTNSFTCYDRSGQLITQSIHSREIEMNLFEAVIRQIGHLMSDVSTPAGLPIPFMPLLQSIKAGNINGKTIGEVSRLMYVKGYNLNHLAAMSIPAISIEILVRTFYLIYNLSNNKSVTDSLPINTPKIDKMLFNTYLIATSCNTGKVILHSGNVFSFNPTIWAGTVKYGYTEFKRYFNNEKERERHQYVLEIYNQYENELDQLINESIFQFE